MNQEVDLWGLSSVNSSRLYLNILLWLVSADAFNLHVCCVLREDEGEEMEPVGPGGEEW